MKNTFKTLALLSSIALVSACSHLHAKEATKPAEVKCPVVEHLAKAAATNASTTSELKEAANNAKDAAAKKHVNKLVATSEKLAKEIESNKKQCEVKAAEAAKAAKPTAKATVKHHAKNKAAVEAAKPADAAAAPAQPAAK